MRISVKNSAAESHSDIQKEYDEFVHIVSHDFSAPLRHVKNFTELLMDSLSGKIDSEQQEFADIISQSTTKMQQMMAALLDYSRVSSAAEPKVEFAVDNLIADVITEFHASNPAHKVAFANDGASGLLLADRGQLKVVFKLLLGNAVKFAAPDRPLELKIKSQRFPTFCRVLIQDNGIGIAEKFHQLIFKLFYQCDPQNSPGVGSGLAICKKIIQRHNGSITPQENAGGTVFVVDIPGVEVQQVQYHAKS